MEIINFITLGFENDLEIKIRNRLPYTKETHKVLEYQEETTSWDLNTKKKRIYNSDLCTHTRDQKKGKREEKEYYNQIM